MDAVPVDQRDTEWEADSPVYRVHLWRASGNGWESKEFELRAAGGERIFTLYALVDEGGRRGLVRLAGIDPTAAFGED